MMVDHALAVQRLDEVDGVVPAFPKVKVSLAKPNDDGLAEISIEGSAHAEVEDVVRALGLPVDVATIRKHTPSTVGFVVSEPARQPSPGAIASRGRIRRTQAVAAVVDKDVIESKPAPKRARTAGRRKK